MFPSIITTSCKTFDVPNTKEEEKLKINCEISQACIARMMQTELKAYVQE